MGGGARAKGRPASYPPVSPAGTVKAIAAIVREAIFAVAGRLSARPSFRVRAFARPGMTSSGVAPNAYLTGIICPSCQHVARRWHCLVGQIKTMLSPVPHSLRGAARDRHGRWERDAMDAHRRAQLLARRAAFVRTA